MPALPNTGVGHTARAHYTPKILTDSNRDFSREQQGLFDEEDDPVEQKRLDEACQNLVQLMRTIAEEDQDILDTRIDPDSIKGSEDAARVALEVLKSVVFTLSGLVKIITHP